MEITGRLSSDAEVRKTKNSKEVIGFTVVLNDYYKTKDGEKKEFSEFINCSYWLSTKIADNLLQGSIVTVTGRIYLNEYKGKGGEHHASLAFHANGIKIIAKGGKKIETATKPATNAVPAETTNEDLPF